LQRCHLFFTNNHYFVYGHQGCREFRVSPGFLPVRAAMFFMSNGG